MGGVALSTLVSGVGDSREQSPSSGVVAADGPGGASDEAEGTVMVTSLTRLRADAHDGLLAAAGACVGWGGVGWGGGGEAVGEPEKRRCKPVGESPLLDDRTRSTACAMLPKLRLRFRDSCGSCRTGDSRSGAPGLAGSCSCVWLVWRQLVRRLLACGPVLVRRDLISVSAGRCLFFDADLALAKTAASSAFFARTSSHEPDSAASASASAASRSAPRMLACCFCCALRRLKEATERA